MGLDLSQNLVSAQYLENKLTEFHQILLYAFILTRSSLGMLPVIFHKFVPELWPLILLHVIFCKFVPELWPLIYTKISFQLNIFRTNKQNFTKFYVCIHIDKIKFVPEL